MGRFRAASQSLFGHSRPNRLVARLVLVVPALAVPALQVPALAVPALQVPAEAVVRLAAIEEAWVVVAVAASAALPVPHQVHQIARST